MLRDNGIKVHALGHLYEPLQEPDEISSFL